MGFNNPLNAAQLAAAIADVVSPVVNVPAPVVNVESPTVNVIVPGSSTPIDEDVVRVLDQAAINALTAADKATNFSIWNTTTQSINYCVNGAVIAPSVSSGPAQGSFAITPFAVTGTYTDRTLGSLGTGKTACVFGLSNTVVGSAPLGVMGFAGADGATWFGIGAWSTTGTYGVDVMGSSGTSTASFIDPGNGNLVMMRNARVVSGNLVAAVRSQNGSSWTLGGNLRCHFAAW